MIKGLSEEDLLRGRLVFAPPFPEDWSNGFLGHYHLESVGGLALIYYLNQGLPRVKS